VAANSLSNIELDGDELGEKPFIEMLGGVVGWN
jgi:hypothetical protein